MVQLWGEHSTREKLSTPSIKASSARRFRRSSWTAAQASARESPGEFRDARRAGEDIHADQCVGRATRRGSATGIRFASRTQRRGVVLEGSAKINGSARSLTRTWYCSMRRRARGDFNDAETKLLLLSGSPLGRTGVAHGLRDEHRRKIYQAIKDYQTGRMGHLS